MTCASYDYIEMACMFHYKVKLQLVDGLIEGKAVTTKSIDKVEHLVLQTDKEILIALDSIKTMDVLTPNARFSFVELS